MRRRFSGFQGGRGRERARALQEKVFINPPENNSHSCERIISYNTIIFSQEYSAYFKYLVIQHYFDKLVTCFQYTHSIVWGESPVNLYNMEHRKYPQTEGISKP
jgi:hypothetical protein